MTTTIVPFTRRPLVWARVADTIDGAGVPELVMTAAGNAARLPVPDGAPARSASVAVMDLGVLETAARDIAHLIEVIAPDTRRSLDLEMEGHYASTHRGGRPSRPRMTILRSGSIREHGELKNRLVLVGASHVRSQNGRLEVTAPVAFWAEVISELFTLRLRDGGMDAAERFMDQVA